MAVKVQNCHEIAGERWCEVTIQPVQINDENLKNYVIKNESQPVWLKIPTK